MGHQTYSYILLVNNKLYNCSSSILITVLSNVVESCTNLQIVLCLTALSDDLLLLLLTILSFSYYLTPVDIYTFGLEGLGALADVYLAWLDLIIVILGIG